VGGANASCGSGGNEKAKRSGSTRSLRTRQEGGKGRLETSSESPSRDKKGTLSKKEKKRDTDAKLRREVLYEG